LKVISHYAIIGYFKLYYHKLFVVIVGYPIGDYWWLLMTIILMVIDNYSINGYYFLLYWWLLVIILD
jgi:hypothetical protein